MANVKQNIDTAISLLKEMKPEERERALGIMQGMLIAKGKTFKEVFPKQKIAWGLFLVKKMQVDI